MTFTNARTAASWLLLTAMFILIIAATWHLAQGVLQPQVEGVIAGGGLMFVAVMAGWLRVSLDILGSDQSHLQARTDWMAEAA